VIVSIYSVLLILARDVFHLVIALFFMMFFFVVELIAYLHNIDSMLLSA